jgi:ketosteroid isomerase-like protein
MARYCMPMSQENLEVVRRIYDAFAARDDATAFQLYADDIVWDLSRDPTALLLTTGSPTDTKACGGRGARASRPSAK